MLVSWKLDKTSTFQAHIWNKLQILHNTIYKFYPKMSDFE